MGYNFKEGIVVFCVSVALCSRLKVRTVCKMIHSERKTESCLRKMRFHSLSAMIQLVALVGGALQSER